MAELFSASEIVQIGINIEENGRNFYASLSKSTESERIKDIFQYLAKEEDKHIKVFEGILSGFETYEPKEVYSDEYFAYLAALSKDYIFTKEASGKRIAENIENNLNAVDLGIKLEKDSILFYHEIRGMVWEKGRGIIDRLIEEERTHLIRLWELKKDLLE